jgi:DNA-binding SARP family transcriptional activator/tetratricopeptide (TPR) repeat protein
MEFGVLGPLQVRSDGRPVPVGAPLQRALLAALLLHANQVVAAEQLIDYLWDQTPPPSARTTLQNYILRLRRLLPERPERAAGQLLVTRAPGYLLQLRPGELDLDRFQGLVADARASTTHGQIERAASLLRDALALWRGPPLCDVASETLRRLHLPRLEDQRLGALEARIDAELGLGLHGELTGELHGLVEEQPLRERFRAQLMLALYRCGRQAEALEVYRSTWRLLHDELGIQPGPELRRLEQAILGEDSSLDLPASTAPGRPPTAAIGPPHHLPPAIADFTGRRQHLDELDRLLGSDADTTAVVISAIAGTAGVGKTALAVHWAHRIRDRFGDGQLHVNLRGYAPTPPMRSIDALAGFLHAVGVPAEQVPVDLEEAAGLYRTLLADKRMLVVLDNARSADQVRPLLPGSPACLVLVTSRDRLGGLVAKDGARRLTLDLLLPEEALGLLTRLLGAERVATEPQAAEELAEVCGLLPLALRIAAANLAGQPGESIAGYVARLRQGDRLAELAVDGDPQAAVGIAFDCSYAALAPDAQRMFRLLGLVPGPEFTGPAAAALAGMSVGQADRLLERLVDAHLLERRVAGRFGFHDLLRRYAYQRTQDQDGELDRHGATSRLYSWYLHTADRAVRLLYPERVRLPIPDAPAGLPVAGFDEPGGALAWLDAERANLVAAAQQAAEHGPRPPAWLLADTLGGYFWHHRHMGDWIAVAHAGADAATAADESRAQAATHHSLGMARWCLGNYAQATEHFTSALARARQAGWVDGQAACLGDLAFVSSELGNQEQAADHLTHALALHQQTGHKGGQAIALNNLGHVYLQMGRPEQAADQLTEAVALHRELGLRNGEALALDNLGEACRDLGRLDDAQTHLTAALALHREIGNRYDEAYDLNILATVQRDAGQSIPAVDLAQAAVALAHEMSDPRTHADALNTLGSIHLCRGHHGRAVEHHQQALDLARQANARHLETEALLGLAAVSLHRGQATQAVNDGRSALTLARQAGHGILEGQAHTIVAAAHLAQDQHNQAIGHAHQALAIHRRAGHRLGQARTLVILGHALRHAGRADAALPCWQQALALFTDIGAPDADQVRDLLQTHAR